MQTICALLDEKKGILKELDKIIVDACDIAEIEKEIEDADEISSRILDIQRLLREKCNPKVIERPKTPLQPQTQPSTPPSNATPLINLTEGEGPSTGMFNSEHLETLHISNDQPGTSASSNDSVATQSQPVTQQLPQRSHSKLPQACSTQV